MGPVLGPDKRETISKLEPVQRRSPGWLGLEHLPWAERLRELGLVSLEMGWLWGNLPASPHTYREPSRKQNWTLYSRAEGG